MLSTGAFNALLKTLEEPPVLCDLYSGNNRSPQDSYYDSVQMPAV